MTNKFTWRNLVTSLVAIALVVVLIWLLSPFIATFFVALLTAYIYNPVVLFFQERLKLKKRGLAIFVSLLTTVLLIITVFALSAPSIKSEFVHAQELLTNYAKQQELPEWLPKSLDELTRQIVDASELNTVLNSVDVSKAANYISGALLSGLNDIGEILLSVFGLFSFTLYFVFILIYYNDFTIDKWQQLIPEKWRKLVIKIICDVEHEMKGYFRAQSKIVIVVSILFAVGFKLISLPLGIGLGIFVGLLNFVPYLQLIGLLPAVLLGLIYAVDTDTNFWIMLLLIGAVFAVVQLIQEIIITPKVMGEFSGMNPALILLSLSIWGGLMGVIGMMLALPLTSLIMAYYRNVLKTTNEIEKG